MSNTLLPCPFCGGVGTLWSVTQCESVYAVCQDCGTRTIDYKHAATAIAAWNRRARPENKPLTLDELRQMAEEPLKHWIWMENPLEPEKSAYFQNHSDHTGGIAFCCGYPGVSWHFKYSDYGKTWTAYDRPPGGEEK